MATRKKEGKKRGLKYKKREKRKWEITLSDNW